VLDELTFIRRIQSVAGPQTRRLNTGVNVLKIESLSVVQG